jgi:hypothetical protein
MAPNNIDFRRESSSQQIPRGFVYDCVVKNVVMVNDQ